MRRRSRRGPNNSESTGKVGQEIPTGALAPLRPNYMDEAPASAPSEPRHPPPQQAPQQPPPQPRPPRQQPRVQAPPPEPEDDFSPEDRSPEAGGRFEFETQPDSMNTPPVEHESVKPRAPKGFVVLAIGLPGSGKTTWFKRRGVQPLSSDMLRTILFDDIDEQRYQKLVFATLRSLLRARLIAKMPWNYVDATNLSPHERRQWIKMAQSFGYDVQAVFFDVPLEVCLERNQRRERKVNEEILTKMAERLRPPHFKEGFSKITMVRVKAKD